MTGTRSPPGAGGCPCRRICPLVRLGAGLEQAVLHGQAVPVPPGPGGLCRIYDASGAFLGLGERGGDGRLHPRRLMRCDPPENLAKHPDSQ